MPGTGDTLAMLGKGNSLTRVVPDIAFSEISQSVKKSAEKVDSGCASDHDSDSDYACEAPDPSKEPSTACRRPLVNSEFSSDLLSGDFDVLNSNKPSTAASSAYNSSLTKVSLPPGSVKWLKRKADPKKIIHVFGLPNGQYSYSYIHDVFGKFGKIIDMLVLYRENVAFVELDSAVAALTAVHNSTIDPVRINNTPVELRPAEEIYRSVEGFKVIGGGGRKEIGRTGMRCDVLAPIKVKTAILKLPSGVHIKCGQPCVVWVFGHSIIAQAAELFKKEKWQQAASNGKISFYWMGFDGLRLYQLREKVAEQQLSGDFPHPDVFILHLGGEDLVHSVEQKMKEDLAMEYAWLSSFFPDSLIVWSEIIPRVFWAFGIEAEKMNRTALKINEELSNLPRSKQFKCILHHKKIPLDYHPGGNPLGDFGIDTFIENVVTFMDSMFLCC